MQMKNALFLASVLLLATCTYSQNLSDLTNMMQKREGDLTPKEFNMLVILKGIKDKFNVEGHDIAVLKDKAVHQSDIIAHAIAQHKKNGGTFKHAYIMSHDKDVKRMNAPLILEMREATGTAKQPFTFRRNRQDLMKLKHNSIENCINSHKMENTFKTTADKFHMSAGTEKKIISKAEFINSKMGQFFGDICKMLEVSKHQARNRGYERNLITHEIKNYAHLMNGPYQKIVRATMKEAFMKSTENAAKVYGKKFVNIMGVQYEHNDQMKGGSHRLLAETVSESTSANAIGKTQESIKYNFSYALLLIYLLVCVSLYSMEVYRDSLVYSTFLTSRKPE